MTGQVKNKPSDKDYYTQQGCLMEKTTAYLLYVVSHLFTVVSADLWT